MKGGSCLVRRFWNTFISLAVLLAVVDVLSWLYIVSHLTLQVLSGGLVSRLMLPTEAPSIWNLVQPGNTKYWLGPILVLVIQVWLTGGIYGTLIRANTNEPTNGNTFIVDGFRSFGKLLLWNLLWAAAAIVVMGVGRIMPPLAAALDVLILILRFVFLFAEIALVAERDARYAIKLAASLLVERWLIMLPFGVGLILLTDVTRWLMTITPSFVMLLIAIVYSVVTVWVLHMIVARYLFFSNWVTRRDSVNSLAKG